MRLTPLRWPALALLGAALVFGCKSTDPAEKNQPRDEAEPARPTAPTDAEPPATPTESTPAGKLLEWLDPDAVSVVFSRIDPSIDTDAFSMVFALPPKIERMLRDIQGVDHALDAVLDPEAPRPSEWLGPHALGAASVVSSGTYVVRPMTAPVAEVEAHLLGAGMQKTDVEGFPVFVPRGPFPWKVVFLEDDVAGFVPVKEIGSGLSPLTAGRDLPPSALETEIRTVLSQDPDAVLDIYAGGPLLHLDLGQDIAQLGVHTRRFQQGGLDVEVRMQPVDSAEQARTSLQSRDLLLETDQVQALAKRVAYTVEGNVVTGRLQATPQDVAVMSE